HEDVARIAKRRRLSTDPVEVPAHGSTCRGDTRRSRPAEDLRADPQPPLGAEGTPAGRTSPEEVFVRRRALGRRLGRGVLVLVNVAVVPPCGPLTHVGRALRRWVVPRSEPLRLSSGDFEIMPTTTFLPSRAYIELVSRSARAVDRSRRRPDRS